MTTIATEARDPEFGRTATVAGILVIALAAALEIVVSRQTEAFEAPASVARGVLVFALLSAPGVIALLAAISQRRALAVAAGVLCLAQSPISFSLITFVFLVPGLILLRAGLGGRSNSPVRPARLAAAIIICIPLAWLLISTIGFIAPILLVAIAGTAPALLEPKEPGSGVERVPVLVAIAVVALVIGAWIAALALTETVCWTARRDAGGAVRVERIPEAETLTLDDGSIASGCDGGLPTTAGVAATGGLLAAAFLISALPLPKARRTFPTPG